MKKHISTSTGLLFILLAAVLAGCEKEKTVSLTGDVIGFVKLVDENENPQKDLSNIQVTIGNSTTATTDVSGKFEMKNIPAGTYRMKFEREGYSTMKFINRTLAGGNEPAVVTDVTLVKFTAMTASNINVTTPGNYQVNAVGNLSATEFFLLKLYVNDSTNVSNEHYDYTTSWQFCCAPVSQFSVWAYLPSSNNFYRGQTLYMAVYASPAANKNGKYNYFDNSTMTWIDPTAKKLSEPIKFVLQ